ncbi:MAG: hypothetical protein KR126chlam1_01471 [Chlamydiae bacterium]|nr:hypothetical protein [Chlamydiota bacterium]
MKKFVKVIFLVFVLISTNIFAKSNESESYVQIAQKLMNNFADEIEKEHGLSCIGTGGRMPYDIEEFSLKLLSHNRTSVKEARELLVRITEKFLEEINSNKKVRPFLREYPFEPFRAEVSIAFWENGIPGKEDGSLIHAFQVKNQIFYYCGEEGKPIHTLLAEEPYEEALKIVMDGPKKGESEQDPI